MDKLTKDQREAAEWATSNSGLLLATPGTGKTRTMLAMLEKTGKRALIVVPASISRRTWQDEAKKIKHPRDIVRWTGKLTPDENAHVIVSYESVTKLLKKDSGLYDTVIFDEVSRLRNPKGKRYKELRSKLVRAGITHRIGLTGTPVANHLHHLYGQLQITSGLPMIYEQWLKNFFIPFEVRYPMRSYTVWRPAVDATTKIEKLLDSRSYKMTLVQRELTRVIDHWVDVDTPTLLKIKNEYVKDAGSAHPTLLHQIAQGAVYENAANTKYTLLHRAKVDRLKELLVDLQGEPVIIFYVFRHDQFRIKSVVKSIPELNFAAPESPNELAALQDTWNAGKISVLIVPPGRAAHGLNLQKGGRQIIWYGVPWDAELYRQGNARLDRQGQIDTVMIHRILTKSTVDGHIVNTLVRKRNVNDEIMER